MENDFSDPEWFAQFKQQIIDGQRPYKCARGMTEQQYNELAIEVNKHIEQWHRFHQGVMYETWIYYKEYLLTAVFSSK